MKKIVCLLLLTLLLMLGACGICESPLSGHAQTIFDAIRWNVNLPKQSTLVHAEEYQFRMTKEITLHTLLMEVTLSQELEAIYGMGGRLMLIDLDTGDLIDYKNFDGDVRWPDEGDVTSKYDALHLLYNCYWSYLEGYNEDIMSMHEFITPLAEEEISAVNAALTDAFIR